MAILGCLPYILRRVVRLVDMPLLRQPLMVLTRVGQLMLTLNV